MFACAICRKGGAAAKEPGHRRDVDDGPAAALPHGGNDVLHHQEHAAQVHVHDVVKVVEFIVLDQKVLADDARPVPQDVHLAKIIHRARDQRFRVRLDGYIGNVADDVWPKGFQRGETLCIAT